MHAPGRVVLDRVWPRRRRECDRLHVGGVTTAIVHQLELDPDPRSEQVIRAPARLEDDRDALGKLIIIVVTLRGLVRLAKGAECGEIERDITVREERSDARPRIAGV